ncbi:hypothetical protein MATL_G00021500 [Megalops atlanticus]|uniref:Queuine tRNA-ribosyltransferase accessory subunit 2 n=1 Tax=Megalops atlanticus TaxID=7932 RepID=A0A9D3QB54_MEGAT|nr:hypothetical protein MATL_G00021500 [Megalops atlanticus]
MRLELSRVVQGCRRGVLTGLGRSGGHSLELPGCLLYTRCASVPHLTHDTLHTLPHLPPVTQISLDSLAEHQEVLEEFGEGVAKFAGLHDTVLFCSLHDLATPRPSGYNTNKTVSVWGSGGRIELSAARYMALQAAIRPDWYQSLADGETPPSASRKRARKAVDRTLTHLDECLSLHHQTQELRGAEIFGVVEGGDVLEERPELRCQLIAGVTKELPEDKPRLLLGVGCPDEVLACVEAGVDLFESSFPFQVTERGCALCFSFNIEPDPESAVLERNGPQSDGERGAKTQDDPEQMTPFEMNLKDKRYRDDFRPLVAGCECYCCRHHQRAYLHHLLVTNELLAGVLLMLHNLTHYCGFFRALRGALESGRLQALRRRILQREGGV